MNCFIFYINAALSKKLENLSLTPGATNQHFQLQLWFCSHFSLTRIWQWIIQTYISFHLKKSFKFNRYPIVNGVCWSRNLFLVFFSGRQVFRKSVFQIFCRNFQRSEWKKYIESIFHRQWHCKIDCVLTCYSI